MEYTAQTTSPPINGEAKITIGDSALAVASLFDTIEIAFAEINALVLADYVITIKTDSGDYAFARMGNWCQPFYDELRNAYHKAVLRSLFIKDSPILTANGNYHYSESGIDSKGAARIQVFENSVATLPPNLSARRVPLCFVSAMDKGDFELTLKLDTNERYSYAKLGYDTTTFAEAVEKQIRKLREETLVAVMEIDPFITTTQASQLARLMPRGAAAPIGQLAEIAPSFATALEDKIAATRAAESYLAFKELCDPAKIWVGFRKNNAPKEGSASNMSGATNDPAVGIFSSLTENGNPLEALNAIATGSTDVSEADAPKQDPFLLWLIAPSPDEHLAAVEFAEANSATFIYRTGGDFSGFARQLNRALEAINFKREVIRLSDTELLKPENADYYMAAKRTVALQLVRSSFVGRVIHSSPEKWRGNLLGYFEGRSTSVAKQAPTETVCATCGKTNAIRTKFCGECGCKIEVATPTSLTCPNCNAQITTTTKFCGECGNKRL